MAGCEAMLIVAGIGCRRGATGDVVVEAIDMALRTSGLTRTQLALLAVPDEKMHEAGIHAAARDVGVAVAPVTQQAMERVSAGALTISARVQDLKGVPSVAETAALAAAGNGARLLAPRSANTMATCAIATGDGR
ncbi:cobalamin biosynthesis protein [Hyphomicrobium sulfonivorans]|nr:cobalamin biosynthesis protein [Hyphomicrobium sulfonivorans]